MGNILQIFYRHKWSTIRTRENFFAKATSTLAEKSFSFPLPPPAATSQNGNLAKLWKEEEKKKKKSNCTLKTKEEEKDDEKNQSNVSHSFKKCRSRRRESIPFMRGRGLRDALHWYSREDNQRFPTFIKREERKRNIASYMCICGRGREGCMQKTTTPEEQILSFSPIQFSRKRRGNFSSVLHFSIKMGKKKRNFFSSGKWRDRLD